MTYLNRPVFEFTIDWNAAVERSVTFDLRETLLGFGAEFFTPTATSTVNGWDFSILLENASELTAFESFADSLTGRLQGFWLPCPLQTATFVAGISTTQFDITAEGLSTSWNERPDQHLLLTYPDGAIGRCGSHHTCQIVNVVANGESERITLAAALPQIPSAGTVIQRLHYVRFADDEEETEFLNENTGTVKLSVIELPLEYTNAATGLQPIFLYHLWADTPVNQHWRYTSFATPLASGGKVFAAYPITHGEIKQTTDGNSGTVDITARPDPAHPFSLLANLPPGKVLWCEISFCYLASPEVTTKLFTGFVDTVEDDGITLVAHCADRLAWLKTKLPRFLIGSTCNHILFERNTCKVSRRFFETTVTLDEAIAAPLPLVRCTFTGTVNLDNFKSDNWFKAGILECGFGVQYEIRSIVGSRWHAGHLELSLNAPLLFAAVGSLLQITTGCDHTAVACRQKFNNFDNFGGFVAVPDQNLALKGLNSSVSQGNKK